MQHLTKLAGERIIPEKKVANYLLDVNHPDGGGKAKFFIRHGFAIDEPQRLAAALQEHSELNDIGDVELGNYGTKSIVRCSIPTPDGRNPCILVVWIREQGSDQQRLVTAYPFDGKAT